MAPRVIRHRSFWAFTTLALLCLAGVCAGVGVIVRDRLAPPEAALLRAILQRHTGEFITLAAVVLVAVALGVDWVFRLYILPIARLSEEVAILFESAPERRLRLHGSREVMRLAESINRAAERVARLQLTLDERIRASASQARAESGVLSVVVAELDEGVVICNPEGVISLYNERARVLLGAGDPPQSSSTPERFGCYVGLGRSLLGLLDKGVVGHLFEDIVDQLRRGRAAARASALVTGCTGRFLRLEAAPILGMRREITGYVLVFSDITRQLEALDRAKMGM
ncbi:MAG TPA: hypothetical protein VMC02_06920, partial [Steroidobacteraceae bacterium]|nr:hypothetical protein [Steroidobacteraceae bacterium]